jgi:hypothetical protein
LVAFTSGTRGSVRLALDFSGAGKQPPSAVVKRLFIPYVFHRVTTVRGFMIRDAQHCGCHKGCDLGRADI